MNQRQRKNLLLGRRDLDKIKKILQIALVEAFLDAVTRRVYDEEFKNPFDMPARVFEVSTSCNIDGRGADYRGLPPSQDPIESRSWRYAVHCLNPLVPLVHYLSFPSISDLEERFLFLRLSSYICFAIFSSQTTTIYIRFSR